MPSTSPRRRRLTASTPARRPAGKPVYVEKPMALDHGECRAMIDACAGRRRAAVHRLLPARDAALPRIKALLDAGAIGTVRVAAVCVYRAFAPPAGALPWRIDPAVSGGGLFVDLASHKLDLLDYFLGPITDVVGRGRQPGRPLSTPRTSSPRRSPGLRRARHRRCGASARRATSIAPRLSGAQAGSSTPPSATRR